MGCVILADSAEKGTNLLLLLCRHCCMRVNTFPQSNIRNLPVLNQGNWTRNSLGSVKTILGLYLRNITVSH